MKDFAVAADEEDAALHFARRGGALGGQEPHLRFKLPLLRLVRRQHEDGFGAENAGRHFAEGLKFPVRGMAALRDSGTEHFADGFPDLLPVRRIRQQPRNLRGAFSGGGAGTAVQDSRIAVADEAAVFRLTEQVFQLSAPAFFPPVQHCEHDDE